MGVNMELEQRYQRAYAALLTCKDERLRNLMIHRFQTSRAISLYEKEQTIHELNRLMGVDFQESVCSKNFSLLEFCLYFSDAVSGTEYGLKRGRMYINRSTDIAFYVNLAGTKVTMSNASQATDDRVITWVKDIDFQHPVKLLDIPVLLGRVDE